MFLAKIKNIFKNSPNDIHVQNLEIGQFLDLTYKDPKTIGIISDNHLTCTRLNDDELKNRNIRGYVISKYFDNQLRIWVIGIRSCKKKNNQVLERDFLFIDSEIEKIKLLK